MSEEYLNPFWDKTICPHCKTDTHADRIPRSWWVKLLFGRLPVKRFMCYKCKRSYYYTIKNENK